MTEETVIEWWDKLPVNERIFLKNKWMPECKHLVNVKAQNLIQSGCYKAVAMNVEYSFWMIWVKTFEGDKRWHMGRFPIDTDAEMACDIVRGTLSGGVGGDASEVLEAEYGYDDKLWRDYTEQ